MSKASPCHHRCSRRPVPVRGRPHLRGLPGLDQPAHGPLPGRGRGGVRAAVPRPEDQPGGDPAADRRAGPAAAQAARRGRVWTPAPTPSAGTWPTTTPRPLSRATINRILVRAGAVTPDPSKRPRAPTSGSKPSSPTSPGSPTSPTTGSPTGTDVEILTWLDDCSRYALLVTAHARVTGPIVLATFRKAVARHGIPASTLTDNGMVFTTRFSGGKAAATTSNTNCASCNITQKNGQPNHPQTQGKVERFQQTLKKWLRAQPSQPATIAELQTLLDAFADEYNHRRPHRSLPHRATPATDLHRPAQSHPQQRPQHRHPRPRPPRQDRQSRQRHPARRRPTPPHRHRPNPRPNRRHPARPGPPRHRHQRRHRRNPARPHHRPPPRLPTHRPTTRPHKEIARTYRIAGPGYSDVLRHHTGRADRI